MWPRDRPTALGPAAAASHFGRDDDVFARDFEVFQRLAEHHFRLAFGIDVGGVDEIDARFERPGDQRGRALLVQGPDGAPEARAAAEGHAAQTNFRDELSRSCREVDSA